MKTRHVLMAIALAATSWLAFFGEPGTDVDIVEPVARTSVPAPANSGSLQRAAKGAEEPVILTLQPRDTLIKGTSSQPHSNTLFGSHNWSPPPPTPTMAPPAPAAAPPLPFKYLGKSKEADQWQVFLAKDEVTLIVKESDVIDSLYRVQSISPPSMILLYLPLSETQSLTIE
jgi:hypothetical protein